MCNHNLRFLQIVILVVDSTDRERLTLTKEELHRMLAHEVSHIHPHVFAADVFQYLVTNMGILNLVTPSG